MQDIEINYVTSGIYCLFHDHLNCAKNWGVYLQAKEFDQESELKNKVIAIWISSLIDPILKEEGWLNNYLEKAKALNLIHLERYAKQAQYFFKSMKNLLSLFSREEQVFITDFRNQLVHGLLAGRHENKRLIRYVERGQLVEKHIPRHEYEEIIRTVIGSSSMDEVLCDLRARFTGAKSEYWAIFRELQINEKIIYEAMMAGREFQFRSIPL